MLYEEWFVRLGFPGHKHTRITDGLPEGWEKVSVPSIVEINPKTPVNSTESICYIPMAALSQTSMLIAFEHMENRTKATGARFQNGDVLFPQITPCLENGKTGFVDFLEEREVACGSLSSLCSGESESALRLYTVWPAPMPSGKMQSKA